jgi:hypothetical protein
MDSRPWNRSGQVSWSSWPEGRSGARLDPAFPEDGDLGSERRATLLITLAQGDGEGELKLFTLMVTLDAGSSRSASSAVRGGRHRMGEV